MTCARLLLPNPYMPEPVRHGASRGNGLIQFHLWSVHRLVARATPPVAAEYRGYSLSARVRSDPAPAVRRAIVAVPFLAACCWRCDWIAGPVEHVADAAHPGFVLRDETAAAGIHFVHRRPTFDPKIAEHRAARRGARRIGVRRRLRWRRQARSVLHQQPLRRAERAVPESRRRHVRGRRRERGSGGSQSAGRGRVDGRVWGDFDNDGREDVLVYRYGYLALFRNVDGRRFEDVTRAAGLRRWVNSNGAIWLDYDRDGLLDLYVTAYFRATSICGISRRRRSCTTASSSPPTAARTCCSAISAAASSRTSPTRWASAARAGRSLPRPPTSTATAGRTSTSRTTTAPRSCTSTSAGERFVLTTAGLESESKSGMSVDAGRCIQPRPARRLRHQHLRARLPLSEQQPAPQPAAGSRAGSATSPRARSPTRAGRGARSSAISTTTAPTSCSSPTGSSPADSAEELLVLDVEDRRRQRPLLRGRRDLARVREREPLRVRAVAGLPQSRRRGLGGRREERRRDGPVRRARRRARRSLESRRAGRDRREPEPAGGAVSRLSRHDQPLDRASSSSARAAIAARSAPRWCSSRAI